MSRENENEIDSRSNPVNPSRSPLISIPDPSQYQSKTPHQSSHNHHAKGKSQSTAQLMSSLLRTPSSSGYGSRGKSPFNSGSNSASIGSHHPCFSNVGGSVMRFPFQLSSSSGGGKLGVLPRVSGGVSLAVPRQLLADVPCFELDEDPSFWKDHNVQVLIRIRPLDSTELASQGYGRCLRQESSQTVVWLGNPETRFTFDHIACESTSQEKLFGVAGLPMVDNCMSGYNSCMFAYGQTGSGKTYTMMGEIDNMDGKLREDCGVTPRIFEYLFTRITKEEESRKHERLTYSCKCSFLEIYNEHITDLLEPSSTNLQLREDLKKGVYVENLSEHSVSTVTDVLKLLQQGAANRKIAATYMNSESSRSHSVFTCIIESRWEKDSMSHLRFGRLNLVDLAGSERQKSSGAEGDRLKEAANINKSLSTLGLVIMSLVDLAQGKHRHVPYRDSRLTFLLQDSLGGNSKTTIIANVSPSTRSANETLSTLKFAQRAKLIQNNAKINEDASGDVIVLQQQIQQLKGQLSLLMKHQHDSTKILEFPPSPSQSSSGYYSARCESSEEINAYDEHKTSKGGNLKTNFNAILRGALRREKLAETEIRRLKAEIEHLNRLSHQREKEAQRSQMMLRLREEKIKRLESLSDRLISADKFYLGENNALREENLLLQEKIDRNPEVIRFASENIRLLEQIRLYQYFNEQGEREKLLAEISELRNQLLELLEVENSYARLQFNSTKEKQEVEVGKELEQCKDMNSKLIREVDELRHQLANGMNFDQETSNSTENGLLKSDSVDDATSNNLSGTGITNDRNNQQINSVLELQFDNVHKQLIDAQTSIATLEAKQFQLINKLESVQAENHRLMKMLDDKGIPQSEAVHKHEEYYRKQDGSRNQDPAVATEVSKGTSITALQATLDKLSCDLKEAHMLNTQYINDQATRLSQDHQTESIRNEVEMETTKTIMYLQEEIDRLQSEYEVRLCYLAEQNSSLRNSMAIKEDELKMLHAEWERGTLELSTFLIDGCRSLGDASSQIKSICSSFPNVNDWVNEHVEKAVRICLEKEETILLLQRSLEDAQKTLMQMEQQLHSLKGATIALTELQQLEKSSCREEIQLCRMSNDSIEVKESTEIFFTSEKDQIAENENSAASVLANSISNDSTGTLRSILEGNQSLIHTNAYAPGEVDSQIELSMLILSEIEDAVSGSCSDAVAYWAALKSDMHDTVSLYKELVQDLLKDVSDMRKEIIVLRSNQGSFQFSNDIIQSNTPLKHESQLQDPVRIRNELIEVKKRLSSLGACFYSFMNMHCRQNTNVGCTGTDEWTSDCSTSCSNSSAESIDTDEKSSNDIYECTSKITEPNLDLNCDEGSILDLFVEELGKAYDVIVKLTDHLMEFCIGITNHSFVSDILLSNPCTLENIKEQGKDAHDQSTSQKFGAGSKFFGELVETQIQPVSFFAKYEEAYATIKEADNTLKAMLKANENANMLTTMWKQAGEKLMADKASMSEEIKQLKFSVLSRNGEKEGLQDQQEISNMLSSLEDCFLQMQTNVEKLFETARREAIEETQAYVGSLRSSMEDSLCKAMQNDIIMSVLQGQMVEYFHKLRTLNTTSKYDRSATREHCLPTGGLELGPSSGDNNSAFHAVECETEGDHTENELSMEIEKLDLVEDSTVNENFALQKELERKETLLKGLLFDFSLLQELASHRKDTKDELQRLVIALSKVQHELQNKTVQLDDVLVQNTKLEDRLAEAVQALFSSNSELDQAKRKLNILLEQNAELKGLLKDLYLKNSEAEDLIEEKKEVIRCLEKEIIHVSSLPEKQLIPSGEDIADALKRVTAERDEFVEKIISLQDKLDMACALADENQAMAVEARQESEANKMYAEQKEEEVKILEHSVEELECTINVLEKKMDEMEEEVEKHKLMRDSLELELQSLRHRLLTVEDLTESMASENSNAVPENKFCRKSDTKSAENNEVDSQIRFLEDENARQSKEIKLFKNYVSELILHAEAQASQYQQKYKTLESMLHEVKTDLSNMSVVPTSERGEKNSTRTRGSSSPFRCIAGLVQQMNQEKDQELSMARLRIEELEAVAISRQKEVCILNTRLATAESMTHDVIRDLLSVKLDISNYANIIDQHQLQKLIEEAQYQRQEFAAMEQENVNLRSQIDDLLEERERCISEINQYRADQIDTQILLEQVQERDQMLIAQNDMLKMDKANLQKRVVELDDMVKKLFKMQDSQSRNQPGTSSLLRPLESDLSERLVHSQKTMSRINNQLAQYRRSDGNKLEVRGKEMKLRKQ